MAPPTSDRGAPGALDALLDRARALADGDGRPTATTSDAAAGDAANLRAALALLDGADASMHSWASYHYARSTLLLRLGRAPEAVAAATEATRLDEAVPEFRANLGAALLALADETHDPQLIARAVTLLQKAAADGPKTALVHNNLGMALRAAGRLDDALAAFDAGLAIDSGDIAARYNRASTLHRLGRDPESLTALDELLAIDPDFAPAKAARAQLAG